MQVEEREPSFACRGSWISERCDLSGKLLWLRVAARSQVHTNTSSRPAARFLQPLSFQQTEFQCEPPPLQRLTRGIEKAGKGGSPVETLQNAPDINTLVRFCSTNRSGHCNASPFHMNYGHLLENDYKQGVQLIPAGNLVSTHLTRVFSLLQWEQNPTEVS